MYKAFDPFLATDTWHTGHDSDQARFNKALNEVVDHPSFHADAMGEYFTTEKGTAFRSAIDRLVAAAHAVREFLAATGR